MPDALPDEPINPAGGQYAVNLGDLVPVHSAEVFPATLTVDSGESAEGVFVRFYTFETPLPLGPFALEPDAARRVAVALEEAAVESLRNRTERLARG